MIYVEDGEADTANKHVDPRFPEWYFTEHFRYTIATECACVRNNWQVGIQISSLVIKIFLNWKHEINFMVKVDLVEREKYLEEP